MMKRVVVYDGTVKMCGLGKIVIDILPGYSDIIPNNKNNNKMNAFR